MKKIMKKIGYFTKVFLAVSLLVNSLSPLSIVFAEVIDDTSVVENGENEIGEVTNDSEETQEKEGEVLEGEGTIEEGEAVSEKDTEGEETTPNGEEITPSGEGTTGEGETTGNDETITGEGTGETAGNDETTTGEGTEETPVNNEETTSQVAVTESFAYSVYVDGSEVSATDGVYAVDSTSQKVEIIGTLTTDREDLTAVYTYDEIEYTVENLKEGILIQEFELPGYLFGEFEIAANATLINVDGEEVELQPLEATVAYGTAEDNADALNDGCTNLGYSYYFIFNYDNTLNVVVADEELIGEIVTDAFSHAEYSIEDNALVLTDDRGVEVRFEIIMLGDVDKDGDVDEDDLMAVIEEAVDPSGNSELNTDINEDGKTDIFDVIIINEMVVAGIPNTEVAVEDVAVDSRFMEHTDPIHNGEEFTLEYIATINEDFINGVAGLINYDNSVLELVDVAADDFSTGHYVDSGKFIYLGKTLRGELVPVMDEEGNPVLDEYGEEMTTFQAKDYVILKITFRPIATGETTVSIDDLGFFWRDMYYEGNNGDSIDLTIETSSDSRLASLTVAGIEIPLEDGVTEYAITVGNDVTVADVEAVLANSNAEITLLAVPEELVEGENTIRIVVTAEDGTTSEYTITVTREASEKKTEETTPAPMNYQEDNTDYVEPSVEPTEPDDSKKDVKPEEPEKEKKGNLSKIIITALILLVIAALIYLIFKDDDDEETKKANKEIDKLKKEDNEHELRVHETNRKEPPKKVNKNTKKGR